MTDRLAVGAGSARVDAPRRRPIRGIAKGVGVAAGIAAAAAGAAAAGFEVEARVLARRLRGLDRGTEEFFGLHGAGRELITADGVRLHVEVDDVAESESPDPVVIWVHGYALCLDSWYFQRRHFAGRVRGVFYDQRSHGRSSRSAPESARIPQLGADLEQVINEVAGKAPVILVGHSMGGMTIMNLARRRPEWFGGAEARVSGVVLVNTSSGEMAQHSIIPGVSGAVFSRVAPSVVMTLRKLPTLVASVRRRGADLGFVMNRRFNSPGVPANKIEFMTEMLQNTPFEVLADFYPAFAELDEAGSFEALSRCRMLIIGSEQDRITPYPHTQTIIDALPNAEVVRLRETGHMSMIERDAEVNAALEAFFAHP